MISHSLKAFSSALISLTDVTLAWLRPQQSLRGRESRVLSQLSGSFYQIFLALFLIVQENKTHTHTQTYIFWEIELNCKMISEWK